MKLWLYPLKKEHSKTKKYLLKTAWTVRATTQLSQEAKLRQIHIKHDQWLLKRWSRYNSDSKNFKLPVAGWKIKDCTRQSIALQQIHLCSISYFVWAKQIQLSIIPLHQYLFSGTTKDTLQDALNNINASKTRWKLWSYILRWQQWPSHEIKQPKNADGSFCLWLVLIHSCFWLAVVLL